MISEHTGAVTSVRRTPRGFSSDLTALVDCEKGPFFVKAVRDRPGGRRDSVVRERLINPYVRPLSPALRWHTEHGGWIVLGFEAVEGRSSDFAPGSPDLPAVASVVDRIGALSLPEVARGWRETRWDRFAVDAAEAELFRGDALLYTDINPSNVLIGSGPAHAVDWAWPTRGAGFIDPAVWVLQLLAAGHTPESAEEWASTCEAWGKGEPRAIDAFAAANLRMYRAASGRKPDAEWLKAMVTACRTWAEHRGISVA